MQVIDPGLASPQPTKTFILVEQGNLYVVGGRAFPKELIARTIDKAPSGSDFVQIMKEDGQVLGFINDFSRWVMRAARMGPAVQTQPNSRAARRQQQRANKAFKGSKKNRRRSNQTED